MSIVRVEKSNRRRWVTVSTEAANDEGTSFAALGLWLYLMSRPDDWRIRIPQLATSHVASEYAVRKMLAELRDAGYARLDELRGEGGRLSGTEWVVFESTEIAKSVVSVDRDCEIPELGESPRSGNSTPYLKNDTSLPKEEGISNNDLDARARDYDLSFLDERSRRYADLIRAYLNEFSPSTLDMLYRRAFGRRASAIGISDVINMQREFGYERTVAALVLTAVYCPNERSLAYTRSILERMNDERETSDLHGSGTRFVDAAHRVLPVARSAAQSEDAAGVRSRRPRREGTSPQRDGEFGMLELVEWQGWSDDDADWLEGRTSRNALGGPSGRSPGKPPRDRGDGPKSGTHDGA